MRITWESTILANCNSRMRNQSLVTRGSGGNRKAIPTFVLSDRAWMAKQACGALCAQRGGLGASFRMGVSFFVSMDYAPVHIFNLF
jgi:hypothetical protein